LIHSSSSRLHSLSGEVFRFLVQGKCLMITQF
jgi:hypothetical protein